MPQVQEILYVCLSSAGDGESNIAFPSGTFYARKKSVVGSVFLLKGGKFIWQDAETDGRTVIIDVKSLFADVAFLSFADADPAK